MVSNAKQKILDIGCTDLDDKVKSLLNEAVERGELPRTVRTIYVNGIGVDKDPIWDLILAVQYAEAKRITDWCNEQYERLRQE